MAHTTKAVEDDGDKLARRLAHFLRQLLINSPSLAIAAGSVFLAVDQGGGWAFFVGAALAVGGTIAAIWTAPKVGQIKDRERAALSRAKQRTASLSAIMDSVLRVLLADLGVDPSKSRVSIYRHTHAKFVLIARWSHVQTLRSTGRTEYAENEGVIGRAWDRGAAIATDLPEDRKAWNESCISEWNMRRSVVPSLRMQSRSLMGKRIEVASTTAQPVGLLMIESLAPRGVNGTHLDNLEKLHSWPLVSAVLQEVVQCMDEQDALSRRREPPT